jgi:hypothetical protein
MRFPYLPMPAGPVGTILMPMLPIRLSRGATAIDEIGLVDTGSSVNVLPFNLGINLGLDWTAAGPTLSLGGNLGQNVAKAVVVTGVVGNYSPVALVFAWTQSPIARLLLGQVNFLDEFDACFFRSRGFFEVQPKP